MYSTKKRTYIHYGSTWYNLDGFQEIRNRKYFNKPYGGLWASPVDAQYGWKQWNAISGFRECAEENSFLFTLSDDANVIHIYSVGDLYGLPQQKVPDFMERDLIEEVCLDFECLKAAECDVIELHLSEEKEEEQGFMEGLYWALYGWHCDSILVLNKDVIRPVTVNDDKQN